MISAGAGGLTYGLCCLFSIPEPLVYGGLLFALTFVVYNFQRLVKSRRPTQETAQIRWLQRHITGVYLTNVLALVASVIFFFYLFEWRPELLLAGAVGAVVCLLYVLRIGSKSLRELPYLKIHLIAMVWVFGCGFFPLMNTGDSTLLFWLFAANHYLFLLAITIPFDIRDLEMDSRDQRTIPQLLGAKAARFIALALLVLFSVVAAQLMPALRVNAYFWGVMAYTFVLVTATQQDRPFWYFGGLLDGSLVLLGISYLLGC